jgi:hypothetical protein
MYERTAAKGNCFLPRTLIAAPEPLQGKHWRLQPIEVPAGEQGL